MAVMDQYAESPSFSFFEKHAGFAELYLMNID
jgi:hypothetical protein